MQTKLFPKSKIPYYEEFWEKFYPLNYDIYTAFDTNKIMAILEDRSEFNQNNKNQSLKYDFLTFTKLITHLKKIIEFNQKKNKKIIKEINSDIKIIFYNNSVLEFQLNQYGISVILDVYCVLNFNCGAQNNMKINEHLCCEIWGTKSIQLSTDFIAIKNDKNGLIYILGQDSRTKHNLNNLSSIINAFYDLTLIEKIIFQLKEYEKFGKKLGIREIKNLEIFFLENMIMIKPETDIKCRWSIVLAKKENTENKN